MKKIVKEPTIFQTGFIIFGTTTRETKNFAYFKINHLFLSSFVRHSFINIPIIKHIKKVIKGYIWQPIKLNDPIIKTDLTKTIKISKREYNIQKATKKELKELNEVYKIMKKKPNAEIQVF